MSSVSKLQGDGRMRYRIIDFMPLVFKCMASQPLSASVKIDGQLVEVDTTIPNYTIKDVIRFSGGNGRFYVGVCLEGGNSWRKQYFEKQAAQEHGAGYKGTRSRQSSPFYKGADLAINLMAQANTSLYRVEGYEADDMIYSLVKKIQMVDRETPIDIITGDSDMLPLVDDQVSVYMRGNRQWSRPDSPENRLYYQVTPESWDDYLSYTSAHREYLIPYNSMLLFKMVRGDKADNVPPAAKGYGPKKYNAVMEDMMAAGVDFANLFRYGVDFDSVMLPVLMDFFPEEMIPLMKFNYEGICLRYQSLTVPKQLDIARLQVAVAPLRINLQ